MYSRTGTGSRGRGRAIRENALARGNTRFSSIGQNSSSDFESRDVSAVAASTDVASFAIGEEPTPGEDRDILKYEMRWTRTPNKHPLRKLATKDDAMKELERMLGRWYGWETDEPEKPELPWRDDRSESEKIIPEPDYYCCPYSRERPVRLLTPPSRPVTPGLGVPFQRGQALRRMYHRGRRCVDTSLPMYLRNGS